MEIECSGCKTKLEVEVSQENRKAEVLCECGHTAHVQLSVNFRYKSNGEDLVPHPYIPGTGWRRDNY